MRKALSLSLSQGQARDAVQLNMLCLQLESKRLRRGKGLSNVMPLRIAPSGVSCLLTINLYGGLAASAVSFFRLPFVLSVPAALKPVLMAILAFLTVFIDLSFGRNAESMGEVMEQVRKRNVNALWFLNGFGKSFSGI